MAEDGEAKAVRGASLLILLQVLSRAVTFIANQVLLRFLTAELLGVSTQLEVYYLSILFFARESLRVAIQRQGATPAAADQQATTDKEGDDDDENGGGSGNSDASAHARARAQADSTQAVVNLGYLAIPLGLLTAGVLGRLYLASLPDAVLRGTPHLARAVRLVALASALELLAEPAFVVLASRLRFGARAAAEAVATLLRCAVTLAAAVWAARRGAALGALPFALGQAAYGAGLLGVYAWSGGALAREEGFSLLPRRLGGNGGGGGGGGGGGRGAGSRGGQGAYYLLGYFYRPTLNLGASMMVQSFVKHILTQGDTLLVAALSTPTAQGVYALANNYGGLVARLLFQPVEESSRSYFSRLLADASESGPARDGEQDGEKTGDDGAHTPRPPLPASGPSKPALHQASTNLTAILQAYTLVSLPLLALGPTAAPLLLSLIAGPQWAASGAGAALAAYVYYIPLLAVNGLAEAFVASVATEGQVHAQSVWMAAFSVAFAGAGYLFMRVLDLGAIGLVAANSVNMACRIVWALVFVRAYFGARGVPWSVGGILPRPWSVAAAAVAAQGVQSVTITAGAAELGVKGVLGELFKIAGVAVPFLAVLYVIFFSIIPIRSPGSVFCSLLSVFYSMFSTNDSGTPFADNGLFPVWQCLYRATAPDTCLPVLSRRQSAAGPGCASELKQNPWTDEQKRARPRVSCSPCVL